MSKKKSKKSHKAKTNQIEKNPIIKDWRSGNPQASRQVTHNLRRRMGR